VKKFSEVLFYLVILFGWGCGSPEIELFEERRILMDTLVSITIYAVDEPENWRVHAASAFDAMKRVEDLATSFNDSSQIGQINLQAGGDYQPVNAELVEIIRQGQEISDISNGAFDITILPLVRLWNFKSPNPKIPTHEEISKRLPLVNFRNVEIKDNQIRLTLPGMGLDLGGVAKGYAVDRAADILRDHGHQDFLVEAGGDLRAAAGELTRGRRNIWIRHPRKPDDFFASIKMDQGAVATSGDYERSFEINGKRYHHILNPKTGYPSSPIVSVTIFAETTSMADAASTAVFVLGPEPGLEFIEQNPKLEGLIIFAKESELYWKASKGIANKINIIAE
jgi:thiamine biosynthesis lipoprotein